jgi:hypothetical protein
MPKMRLSRLRPRIQGIGHKIRKPLSLHGKFPFPQTGRFCRKLTLRVSEIEEPLRVAPHSATPVCE